MKDARSAELAAIHVAKKQLSLDDETYRMMLFTLTGKRSAGELDFAGRRKVLEHLQSRGFRNVKRHSARVGDDPMARKLRALWATLATDGIVRDASESGLRAFIERQTGVRTVEWLSTDQAMRVIEALKAWHKRASFVSAAS